MEYQPVYLKSRSEGLLKERVKQAYALLAECVLCARSCRVNRQKGETGFCELGDQPVVSSFAPHFGEEAPLVGKGGSGTIFLTGCNLGCLFCQNYEISHLEQGFPSSPAEIAGFMLSLQKKGCHNINLVTPTHQMPFLLKAVELAAEKGLKLPLVWNCGGYESPQALFLLEGIVDIYMPDFKYWEEKPALKYSHAPDYPETARKALKEMHRQVGDLTMDKEGIAYRGLLVRHLVLPDDLAGTGGLVEWLKKEISPDTYINIMAQYRPCYQAENFPELARRITNSEYRQAENLAKAAGLRLDRELSPRS